MTVTPKTSIVDGSLVVHGKTILTGVPENIVLTPGSGLVDGAFIGATSAENKCRHVFPIGVLEGLRFICLFRFKLWWMTQRMGTCGKDVPLETQFMVLESKYGSPLSEEMDVGDDERTVYTVFLPLLEGSFRAVLQGNERNEVEICLESGDSAVKTTEGLHAVYIHAGTDPFQAITDAVKAVEMHLQTFRHRDGKKIPSFLDWFGWCTWDAFYTDVTAEGVHEGLKSLSEGSTPPRFLIIDDGWQEIGTELDDTHVTVQEGAQFASRLTGIKENQKFQKHRKGQSETRQDEPSGLRHVIEEAKEHHNVKYVYVWHALTGYWGGVKPAAAGMEHYDTALAYPVQCPGILGNQPDIVMDSLSVYGLGLVHPKKVFNFYNELHSYLASSGVDGVKVDVQNIIETLGAGHGGRVSITRQYHQALEASVFHNFPDNGCIACMCHNTDGLYSTKQTAVIRASDDFFPRDPASHTIHICSVAYNTLFLGEFMQPDWDMFHSLHPAAEYHGAARAVGGSAIYVSDKPGIHNFDLLRKLVLPDGSVLRAKLPGRPTRDCLFIDPARDGKSLLKIWNLNKYTGILGAFNCQGAGWCKVEKKNRVHDTSPMTLTGTVHARDVDLLPQLAGDAWNGDCVFYAHRAGDLVRLPKGTGLPVSLNVLEFELYTVSPIKDVGPQISFAPIGLINMFNSGGAIDYLDVQSEVTNSELLEGGDAERCATQRGAVVKMKVRGCGTFAVYSTQRPKQCSVDSLQTEFTYDDATGLATFMVPVPTEEMYRWDVKIEI